MDKIALCHQMYREIRSNHQEIHDMLINWARWCKVNRHLQSVQSLEGRYRPPPMYHEPVPSNPPNLKDAYKIERLIASAPHQYGDHLRYWYIRRLSMQASSKKLKIGYYNMAPHLSEARQYILRII